MARSTSPVPQSYPRIDDMNSPYHGCLDESSLNPHEGKISEEQMRLLIKTAIEKANQKSSREILSVPDNATESQTGEIYRRKGKELFIYFKKYCGDPASTAYQINGKHYHDVGVEQFRNRTLQKERMNSGWRYQFLATECASHTKRFTRVSDIGTAEADFNAVVEFLDKSSSDVLNLYVSIKNRSNTMGGQDWPKAISALENLARADKNRIGPYCCVFGVAMERCMRRIKQDSKTKKPHSANTEVWFSDFFWPFFANYAFDEIMTLVLDVLIDSKSAKVLTTELDVPQELLDQFGVCCADERLVDSNGYFSDPYRLVKFFCEPFTKQRKAKR